MTCQLCNKNAATTHYKRTVNGKTTELFVCQECAAKQGIGILGGGTLAVGNLFGGLFSQPLIQSNDHSERCEGCGKSFREIVQSGLVGCPNCYIAFFDRLQPSIQRVHGKTTHVGKVAAVGSKALHKANELERLKAELNKAVSLQEYEKCAELRDRIQELEGEQHE